VAQNLVPDRRFHYEWFDISEWQVAAVKKMGLLPEHNLLDVGCGSLRFGMEIIPYLNDGNYYGVDAFAPYLSLGKNIMEELGVEKNYSLLHSVSFEFDKFETKFDFAFAQSVFTHLSKSQIEDCIHALKKVMKPDGLFLFTYLQRKQPLGFLYYGRQPMIYTTFCTDRFLQKIASQLNLEFKIVDLDHPSQRVGTLKF
ncbi:class I SAM-dependent methyltransferase, partial [Flavobacteriales bacterium AH-315-E23]|nr:class I SAM-dependent methyltransferase [Flavobacteriales bacterium AH-315-E23]